MTQYTEMELDALRELANIGSGTAGTALASMLGRTVDLSVPTVLALEVADAVDALGPPETLVTAVAIACHGDLDATVLLLFPLEDAATLCRLLGVEADSEVGESAMGEIGNILGTSYVGALAMMTGLAIEPSPPIAASDMLAAVVASMLAERAESSDFALIMDSEMKVEGEACSLSFLLLPTPESASELLVRLGVG